jgi:hypothetical protein
VELGALFFPDLEAKTPRLRGLAVPVPPSLGIPRGNEPRPVLSPRLPPGDGSAA